MIDTAAAIEKAYGQITFKDPCIRFGYNKITFRKHASLLTRIYMLIGLMSILFIFIYFKFPTGYLILSLLVSLAAILYEYQEHFYLKVIDILSREVRVENRFPLFGYFRRIQKKPFTYSIDEISHFDVEEAKFSFHRERRTDLRVKFFDHDPLTLAEFRFEHDARKFANILQQTLIEPNRLIDRLKAHSDTD